MRKLTGAVFQSLDGVMQAPGGPSEDPTGGFRFGGWMSPFWDEDIDEPDRQADRGRLRPAARQADLRHLRRLLAVQPGQRRSATISAHQQICADPFGRAARAGRTAASSRATRPTQSRSSSGARAATCSSRAAARSTCRCSRPGLIDRLILMTFPVVLGDGKRIFDGSARRRGAQAGRSLRLDTGGDDRDVRAGRRGARPARFETKAPSAAELERREQWRKEAGEPRPLWPPVLVLHAGRC